MPEIAENAALLCDPNSPEEIAEAMLKIVENKELRIQLIDRAKEIASKYSWDKTAKLLWDSIIKTLQ